MKGTDQIVAEGDTREREKDARDHHRVLGNHPLNDVMKRDQERLPWIVVQTTVPNSLGTPKKKGN